MYTPLLIVARGHSPPHCENTQVVRKAITEDDDDIFIGSIGHGLKWLWAEMVMGRNDQLPRIGAFWFFYGQVNQRCFLYQNGPDYLNGLPEWTFICVIEYFSFGL